MTRQFRSSTWSVALALALLLGVARGANAQTYVFARGLDSFLWYSPVGSINWQSLGGAPLTSAPDAASWEIGRAHV